MRPQPPEDDVERTWVFAPASDTAREAGAALSDPLAALFRFVEGLGARPRLLTADGPVG